MAAELTDGELDVKLQRAHASFASYRLTKLDDRAKWLMRAAELLEQRVDDFATLIVREMGKPVTAARAEVAKSARGFRFYAARGGEFLADEPVDASVVGAKQAFAGSSQLRV